MTALIELSVWLLGWLCTSPFGLGLVCLLTAFYGVGSGWPVAVCGLLLAACAGLWLRSLLSAWQGLIGRSRSSAVRLKRGTDRPT